MFDPPMYDQVAPHTDAVRQALVYLRKSQLPTTPVVGAINPYLGKHLDSLAPPRPSLPLLDKYETFDVLEVLLDDIDSAVSLTGVENWVAIEDHFLSLSRRKNLLPYIRSVHQVSHAEDSCQSSILTAVHTSVRLLSRSHFLRVSGPFLDWKIFLQ